MHSQKTSILSSLVMLSSLIIRPTYAGENYWATKGQSSIGFEIFSVNSTNGSSTSYGSFQIPDPNTYDDPNDFYGSPNEMLIEDKTGDLFINLQPFGQDNWYRFNPSTKTLSRKDPDVWSDSYEKFVSKNSFFQDSSGNVKLQLGETKVIEKKSNGELHIGENSFVIGNDLIDGAHPIWAEDENGTKVPLNIYGSDLHINGKSVQGQIDGNASNIKNNASNIKNLGEGVAGSTALTAALTALPQTSKESKVSCGLGTGAYSSRYAVGFGCASKVNKRVDINAGGSYVFGGSKSYGRGTLDSGVVKAGFVFKLGKIEKPNLMNFKEKKIIDQKISSLEKNNKKLKEKNDEIISQNQKLLARLEKLENIALKFQTDSKMISVTTKD